MSQKIFTNDADTTIPAVAETKMGVALNLQPDTDNFVNYGSAYRNLIIYGENDKWYRILSLSELGKVADEMRMAGRIDLKYCLVEEFDKYKDIINEAFKKIAKNDGKYSSVIFSANGLVEINGIYGYVGANEFYYSNNTYRAFKLTGKQAIGSIKGEPKDFGADMYKLLNGHAKAQILFSHLLTGIVKQFLEGKILDLGELGIVISLQGESGSGKTTVTINMVKSLFSSNNVFSKNMTNVALLEILKNAGVQPVLVDDASVDNKNNKKHRSESTEMVFTISQGSVRQRYNQLSSQKVYAPYLESRESSLPLSKLIRGTMNTEGQKFRFLEIHCEDEELLYGRDIGSYNSLSDRYCNMGVFFMRTFVDMQQQIVDIYGSNKRAVIDKIHLKNINNGWVDDDDSSVRRVGLEDRYANRLAVILTASDIAKEAYGIAFDKPAMIDAMVDEVEKFHRTMYGNVKSRYLRILYSYINQATTQIASDKKGFDPSRHMAYWESGNKIICFNADYFCSLFVLDPDEDPDNLNLAAYSPWMLSSYGEEHFKLHRLPEVSKISKLFAEWNSKGFLYKSTTGYTFRSQITRGGNKVTYHVYKVNIDQLCREFGCEEKVSITEYDNYTTESELAEISQRTGDMIDSI